MRYSMAFDFDRTLVSALITFLLTVSLPSLIRLIGIDVDRSGYCTLSAFEPRSPSSSDEMMLRSRLLGLS